MTTTRTRDNDWQTAFAAWLESNQVIDVFVSDGSKERPYDIRSWAQEIPAPSWQLLGTGTLTAKLEIEHTAFTINFKALNEGVWDGFRQALEGLFGGKREYGFAFRLRDPEQRNTYLFFVKQATCEYSTGVALPSGKLGDQTPIVPKMIHYLTVSFYPRLTDAVWWIVEDDGKVIDRLEEEITELEAQHKQAVEAKQVVIDRMLNGTRLTSPSAPASPDS